MKASCVFFCVTGGGEREAKRMGIKRKTIQFCTPLFSHRLFLLPSASVFRGRNIRRRRRLLLKRTKRLRVRRRRRRIGFFSLLDAVTRRVIRPAWLFSVRAASFLAARSALMTISLSLTLSNSSLLCSDLHLFCLKTQGNRDDLTDVCRCSNSSSSSLLLYPLKMLWCASLLRGWRGGRSISYSRQGDMKGETEEKKRAWSACVVPAVVWLMTSGHQTTCPFLSHFSLLFLHAPSPRGMSLTFFSSSSSSDWWPTE